MFIPPGCAALAAPCASAMKGQRLAERSFPDRNAMTKGRGSFCVSFNTRARGTSGVGRVAKSRRSIFVVFKTPG